jgi:hypothetical protein
MLKVIGGAQEGEFKAVASGTLPNGKPVVVNADGTVSTVSGDALGSQATLDSVLWEIPEVCFDSNANRFVYFYLRSNQGYAVVGQMTNTTMSFGTPVSMNSNGSIKFPKVAFDSNTNKVLFAFQDKAQSEQGTAVVGTVDPSDNSISFGSEARFTGNNGASNVGLSFDSNVNKFVISFKDSTNSGYATARTATISGTSVSFGTPAVYASEGIFGTVTLNEFDSNVNKTLLSWDDSSGQDINLKVATISGTDLSFGTGVQIITDSTNDEEMVFDTSANKFVIFYNNATPNPAEGQALVATISGTDVSVGSVATFSTDDVGKFDVVYNPDTGSTAIVYQAPSTDYAQAIMATVSGTTVSFGSPFLLNSAAANEFAVSYDTNTDRFGVGFGISGSTVALSFGTGLLNLTSENYIGMSSGAAELENVGSPVTFESGATSYSVNTYDSNADRMVVAYSDAGDSGKGKVAVGTVSGDTTSFGTPVDFTNYQIQQARIVFDTNSNKIVIAWIKSSDNAGMSIVGTVDPSDNSISFGSEVQFEAGLAHMSLGFDSTNNKIISAFADLSDNNHGYAIVGTVSGTSISFGSTSKFEAENTRHTDIAHDPDAGKTVIAYMDQGNSSYGTAVVSTVSGTSISFGTPVVYESSSTNDNSVVYDTNSNKMVIAYSDGGNSSYGTAVVGTVSGTSISFGTPVVFHAAGYILQPICTFDAGSNKVVIVYMDNANDGRYVVGAVSGTSISFDASSLVESNATFSNESFWVSNIGLNKNSIVYRDDASSNVGRAVVLSLEQRGEVASGGAATVDIIGSLSTNQGGLTAGQQYFVQTDGTIGTTAGDPSVLAGTAISATELVVKT